MRLLLLVAALAGAVPPLAAQDPVITEWPVPWERTRPRDPFVDRQGRVWFVGQTGDYVGLFEPATAAFRRYELEPGTGPHNLVVDTAGLVWYAGNRTAHIGRLDPRDGRISRYPMPDSAARDPHTLAFDRRGDIWFTVQGGNFVGKLTVATGEVQLVPVPTPRARPYGIVVGADNRPWIVLFGANKLATVDPVTFRLTEHALPRAEARPRRLVTTADGAVWYGDYVGGYLGRFDPASGQVTEWPLPAGASGLPYAMALDDRERIWVVETGVRPNRLVGFDTRSRRVIGSAPLPSGGGTVRHMVYHAPTRTIWFGTDTNQLGRARVP